VVAAAAAAPARLKIAYSMFSPPDAVGMTLSSSSFSLRIIVSCVSFPITSSAKSLGKS
jgi:hypothetical protein